MRYAIILTLAVLIAACGKEKQPAQTQDPAVTKITYKNTIEATIKKYCYGCHSPERTYHYSNAGDLHTYAELVKRVESGELKDRVLVKKNMPISGFPSLNSEEMQQLQEWLDNQYPLE